MNKKIYGGALILGLSNVIVKILGLFIIIPFAKMVGPVGSSLYTYAFVPFVFFMDVSTLGVVPGISKLTSKLNSENEEMKSRYLLYKSRQLMLLIGVISFIILNILAPFLAKMILGGNDQLINSTKDITLAIRCISPALLIGPAVSLYRGFLQGHLNMIPTAISLIIEQIIRFIIILLGAYIIIKINNQEYKPAVYLAVLSSGLALFVTFIFLTFAARKYSHGEKEEFSYLKKILKICIPFGITTIFITFYQLIDSMTFNRYLLRYGSENVETYYALYSFESMRLIIIPVLLAQSLATSLMPNITKLNTSDKLEERNKEIIRSLNIVISLTILIVILIRYFSKEVYQLFYNNDSLGPEILASTSLLIIFFGVNKVLIAIMQGINQTKYLIITTIFSFFLKYILNIILISKIGYFGAIISSVIAISLIISSSIYILHKEKIYQFNLLFKNIFKYGVISLLTYLILVSFRLITNINMIDYKTILFGLSGYSVIYFTVYYLINKMFKK